MTEQSGNSDTSTVNNSILTSGENVNGNFTVQTPLALSAKKENRLRSMRPGIQRPVTDSVVTSILDPLQYVNKYSSMYCWRYILAPEADRQGGGSQDLAGDVSGDVIFVCKSVCNFLSNIASGLHKSVKHYENANTRKPA